MFLAHKVEIPKWERMADLSQPQIPADGLSRDLRTSFNKISFWRCQSTNSRDESVRNVALALASGATRIVGFQLVFVPLKDLAIGGFNLIDSPGRTPFPPMRTFHLDVTHLDLTRWAELARLVGLSVKNGSHCSYSQPRVEGLLVDAFTSGDLEIDSLNREIRPKIEALVAQQTNRT